MTRRDELLTSVSTEALNLCCHVDHDELWRGDLLSCHDLSLLAQVPASGEKPSSSYLVEIEVEGFGLKRPIKYMPRIPIEVRDFRA
jgi:hypothetical protein